MNPILAPWLAECVILTARSVKRDHRPPLPSEFVATFVVFGTASMIANTKAQDAATVFSWGIVIATLLNLFDADGRIRLQPKGATVPFSPNGGSSGSSSQPAPNPHLKDWPGFTYGQRPA